MIFPVLYIDYLFHFHGDRDYFECHEVLEEHWKENGMERDSVWVGLIQTAVSFYHHRRGNTRGAIKMMKSALSILDSKRTEIHSLGINHLLLMGQLHESFERMQRNESYQAIHLPIQDTELLTICKERAKAHGYPWGGLEDLNNTYLINKHRERRYNVKEKDLLRSR